MAKTDKAKSNTKLFYVVIAILFVVAVFFAYLYVQIASSNSSIESNYATLQTNYNTQGNQLNTANSNLANVSRKYNVTQSSYETLLNKYNITEYNLTHPYTYNLYTDYLVSMPAGVYNYYTSATNYSYRPGEYNFSFVAKYPGYIIINGTSTNVSWLIALTENNFTLSRNNTFKENGWFFNYPINQSIAPTQQIPVVPGRVHLYIFNYNLTQGTVTFSAKYVGFHTS